MPTEPRPTPNAPDDAIETDYYTDPKMLTALLTRRGWTIVDPVAIEDASHDAMEAMVDRSEYLEPGESSEAVLHRWARTLEERLSAAGAIRARTS
jgi:hypothetical protein